MAARSSRGPGPSPSQPVYVDTSAFIAFLDRSDSHHLDYRNLFADPPPLVTSTLVVAELHGWFLRRHDARRAMDALDFLDALTPLRIETFDDAALRAATIVLKRYSDQELTLADAHGLTLLATGRFQACWSLDRHLALAGAPLAP